MLELSGRVERLAVTGGAHQITGQAQVKFFNRTISLTKICLVRVRVVRQGMFLLMWHEFRISIA